MRSWEEEFRRKTTTPEEAAGLVESGDRIVIPATSDPLALELAIIARKDELSNVEIQIGTALRDLPWFDPSWHDSFNPKVWHILEPNVRRMVNEYQGADPIPMIPRLFSKIEDEMRCSGKRRNIVLTEVSPPDEDGYCSFGPVLWDKKDKIRKADISIVEIRDDLIRTHGDNFIHISDIDYFVPTDYTPVDWLPPIGVEPHVEAMVPYISELVVDGDTLQIGAGTTSEGLIMAGLVDGRTELGWHCERLPRGCLKLMREQPELFNGRRKTINPGKAVVTAVALTSKEDAEYVNSNPYFEFYGPDYIHDIHAISAHDNMVAINNALMVDLTGQICVETIGHMVWGSVGGQFEFVLGACLSRGGRSITVLPSTTGNGTITRIVPVLPLGSVVSIPRYLAHFVVTEHGRANLLGKSARERATELIRIAHPDFREMLNEEAAKMI